MRTHLENTAALYEKLGKDPENKLFYRNMIVEENLRLVAHVLKRYRPYNDDQYQAGCMGLIVAVDTFDASREIPFPLYACFCIEREIHKMHRKEKVQIETVLADKFIYLDDKVIMSNGDEVNNGDIIPDVLSAEAFDKVLEENSLTRFFSEVIEPAVNSISEHTKGQVTKVDIEQWKLLEKRYILELAEVDSQKVRLNYSQMAKLLGLSVQNVRNRHQRVLEAIRHICKVRGQQLD